ncbi:MAG: hypothetical protein QNK35_06160 [Bacteroides sp.]|nr:hypothetical protein [Bacteroides sp.]
MRPFKSPGGVLLFALAITFLFSCEKENPDLPHPVSLDKLSGKVQKGPFLNGTSITVAELNADMGQTGKNFSTQISDNRGSFELKQVELSSQFVELKADGFYFNEVLDESSAARLILYALSNLSDKSTLNVNLLSHLEKERVYVLMDQGLSFTDAKDQAQKEILAMFSIEKTGMETSELLDISQQGDEHAILLAISVILQGHRTVAELSELLANINSDMREDGELNSESTGSALFNGALWLDLKEIRENLESRYAETGQELVLPDFEKYVEIFMENTAFEASESIVYPEFSEYGENVLFGDKSIFDNYADYSLSAYLPRGASLMIRMSGGMWYYRVSPNGPLNWKVSEYNMTTKTQTFTAIESGASCDLAFQFGFDQDSTNLEGILIEYFENGSETATRSKTVYLAQ